MENTEKEEVYDEAKDFLEEVKDIIHLAIKIGKKVEYKSEKILILSLKDDLHTVFEVYNNEDKFLQPKLVYIGDSKLKGSCLLNLIHREELHDLYNKNYT